MIEAYRAWKDGGASEEQAAKATRELESLLTQVNSLETKVNIIIALVLLVLGSIGGLYYQLVNIASKLPR